MAFLLTPDEFKHETSQFETTMNAKLALALTSDTPIEILHNAFIYMQSTRKYIVLKYIHTDPIIRKLSEEFSASRSIYYGSIFRRDDLYRVVNDSCVSMNGFRKHLLNQFMLNGCGLKDRARFKIIDDEITEMCIKYRSNIQDHDVIVDGKKLTPVDVRDLSNDPVALKRTQVQIARTVPQNLEIMRRLVLLRRDMAIMLGFKSYNEMCLSFTMMKKKYECTAVAHNIAYQDIPYEINRRDALVGIDRKIIEQYFEFDKTIEKIISFLKTIKIYMTPCKPKSKTWHPSVMEYTVTALGQTGKLFMDLRPRDNKHTRSMHYAVEVDPKKQTTNIIIMSVGDYMTHSDVVSLFHEIGHSIHTIIGSSPTIHNRGTNISRDYVEIPSTFFENFAWDAYVLGEISEKDGAPMSSILIKKLIDSRFAHRDLSDSVQMFFTMLDQNIHEDPDRMDEIYDECMAKYIGTSAKEINVLTRFGHLAGGYASEYYTYLYAADVSEKLLEIVTRKGNLAQCLDMFAETTRESLEKFLAL